MQFHYLVIVQSFEMLFFYVCQMGLVQHFFLGKISFSTLDKTLIRTRFNALEIIKFFTPSLGNRKYFWLCVVSEIAVSKPFRWFFPSQEQFPQTHTMINAQWTSTVDPLQRSRAVPVQLSLVLSPVCFSCLSLSRFCFLITGSRFIHLTLVWQLSIGNKRQQSGACLIRVFFCLQDLSTLLPAAQYLKSCCM